jgi:ABC-2 type transport system permease protein
MKKTVTVLKNEIITLLSRPSFWLTTFGIPIFAWLIFGLVGRINQNSTTSTAISGLFSGPSELRPEGYVDLAGLIKSIPSGVPVGTLLPFADEAAARTAIGQDSIAAFYIIPKDYLENGQLLYFRSDFNPLASGGGQSALFQWVLQVNLLGGNTLLTSLVNGPLDVQEVALAPTTQPSLDENNPMAFMLPYGVTLLFYFLIMGSSSLLLSNVSKEKENRVMETLLTSLTPTQLLTGKIIGLGLVGLLQTILWLGTGYALLNLSGTVFSLPFQIQLPGTLLMWGIIFFILGYAVYASLMAGLGALAPNMREASQVTIVIMLPLIIPLFFSSSVFVTEPNGPIATVLSIFPLSAPVAMMARLASGGVPWWQPLVAALLLALTAVFIVRAVAGMFRAQALLSGQPIKIKNYLQALLGRS